MTIRHAEPSELQWTLWRNEAHPKIDERFRFPFELTPMEASTAERLPRSAGQWQYEPKWDGFRCLVIKVRDTVELRGKSGKSLNRFFPEVLEMLDRKSVV